ncbi:MULTISPECIES: CheR family methyltransferase [Spirulina sp. CCY15215]|uniref:CheR family methyltransferase n=1 Tax=Spirulina sp. CCY15215 TaxID=2767591 RepID=UPI00195247A7|nr:CheR family methyltransferase [Spirulina major]
MSSKQELNPFLIESFVPLIAKRTGLEIQEHNRKTLGEAIQSRMKSLHLSAFNSYYDLLITEVPEDSQEWQNLICLLTNPESYFFRDRGQFSLLERYVLPQLIKRRQKTKTLRLWSAGCSTGEEAYSLAIVLDRLLLDSDRWNVLILGTDINRGMLQRAKEGLYGNWSFRASETALQQQYFHATDHGYLLHDRLRQRVRFQYCNLTNCADLSDSKPDFFDLIVCRNVFIYFTQSAIEKTLQTFSRSLSSDGYFLTGHAELYGQNSTLFKSEIFPESILYQKNIQGAETEPRSPIKDNPRLINREEPFFPLPQTYIETSTEQKNRSTAILPSDSLYYPATASPPFAVANQTQITPETLLQNAETLFLQKEFTAAIANAENALKLKPQSFDAFYLLAQIYANSGKYQQAIQCCQQALKIDVFSVKIYYLIAQIARECGRTSEEKQYYKKILYLEPHSISAYRELAYLYEREGDRDRAQKMNRTALELETQTSKQSLPSPSAKKPPIIPNNANIPNI